MRINHYCDMCEEEVILRFDVDEWDETDHTTIYYEILCPGGCGNYHTINFGVVEIGWSERK